MATHTFSVFEFFHDNSFDDYPKLVASPVSFSIGLNALPPVRVTSNVNVDPHGFKTIDNVQLFENDRVLLTNQNNHRNGIYTVSAGEWQQRPNIQGDAVVVLEGTAELTAFVKIDTRWLLLSTPISLTPSQIRIIRND